jgi:glycosyltransferase involved in cell wall biosynthesis
MVLLIGNYAADRQQSMQRFATMMLRGLTSAGVAAELIAPKERLGRFNVAGHFVTKWLGYIDKFVFFPTRLKRQMRRASLVHICDHSNAMYSRQVKSAPVVVTCHDLLAVRGALGEDTDCPASATGKFLQRWILRGLASASVIACDSRATRHDAERLVRRQNGRPQLEYVPLALSHPYHQLPPNEVSRRLREIAAIPPDAEFVLHVGSNSPRKNRETVLRVFARVANEWNGLLVFAGTGAAPHLRQIARDLKINDRIIDVPDASNELLEALYNRATALLYPSRFEGFGWPIIEAQACGCPVICSDREPMLEVSGGAALVHDVADEEGFAADLLRLTNPQERAAWSARGLQNAQRFSAEKMVARYIELYRELTPAIAL